MMMTHARVFRLASRVLLIIMQRRSLASERLEVAYFRIHINM